ncbi:hypothetical protein F5H01DRAFT_343868 [Linnemannia elongata]|nr:hypothetical protein F5H01DRAFT_343868 [Linnemannia elongata]
MDFTIPRSSATILLVGHAGIGKRRLASYIRKEIVPPPTLTSSSTNPVTYKSSNSITTPSTSANVAQPFNRSSSSSTKVSFRTAESIPDGIRHEDGQVSLLPIFKAFPPTVNNSSSTVTGLNDQGAVDSVTRYDLILLLITMANRDSWDDCKRAILRLDPGWFLGRVAIVVTEVANVSKYAFDRDEIPDFVEQFYDIPTVWTNLNVSSEATLAAAQIVRLLEISSGYRREDRDYSFAGLAQTTAAFSSTRAQSALSSPASLSGLYLGSDLGSRANITPSFVRTPITYYGPVTVMEIDDDQEMVAEEMSSQADMKRVRGDLEDEDA